MISKIFGIFITFIIIYKTLQKGSLHCPKYNCSKSSNSCANIKVSSSDANRVTLSSTCRDGEKCNIQEKPWKTLAFSEKDSSFNCTPDIPSFKRFPGEDCNTSEDCFSRPEKQGECVNKKCSGFNLDETCQMHSDCIVGLYCEKGKCQAQKGLKASCKVSYECINNLLCQKGKCSVSPYSLELDAEVEGDFNEFKCKFGVVHEGYCVSFKQVDVVDPSLNYLRRCEIDEKCNYVASLLDQSLFVKKDCECGFNTEGYGYCPRGHEANIDDRVYLYKEYSKSFDMPCHTLSRSECYLLGETFFKNLKALEFQLNNDHLFYNSVSCAQNVFNYIRYVDIEVNKKNAYSINKGEEKFIYLRYLPNKFKAGLYWLSIIPLGDTKEVTVVYDYYGCSTERKATSIPYEDDNCQMYKGDPKQITPNIKMFIEQTTPIYIGIKFIGSIELTLLSEELYPYRGTGIMGISPKSNYSVFDYQATTGSLGYIAALVSTYKEKSELAIYYDKKDCQSKSFTKLPRSTNNCRQSKGIDAINYYIPNIKNEHHYIAIQGYYDLFIRLEFDFIASQVMQINTHKSFKLNKELVNPLIVEHAGSEEVIIKVLNTNPLNSCRIYVDYEGCGRELNKLPNKQSYCEVSKQAGDGDMCLINIKTSSDKIYFGVEVKLTEKIYIQAIDFGKK
jgi:hypothetical protein